MMFGMREVFTYRQCIDCECLQIEKIPDDISRFYPDTYDSYRRPNHSATKRRRRGLRRRRILTWPRALLPVHRLMSPADRMFYVYRRMGMTLASRVLDVGTGWGSHAIELRDAGVSQTIGLDPFIDDDIDFEGRPLVWKKHLGDVTGLYDFITLHHSLEHMPDQIDVLTQARCLLAPKGQVLVRIPTVTSEAFETYREYWVNLDAPRHFFLHSHKSLKLAASRAGLRCVRLWCDSYDMQFMGSEQYFKDIPLMDPRSVIQNKTSELFTRAMRRAYARRAVKLNRALRGDMICAVFTAD
jgi:Methyltransferase domain